MKDLKRPPGIVLYYDECNSLFTGAYTTEEIGEIISEAWYCAFCGEDQDTKKFSDRGMQMGFNAVMRSIKSGLNQYEKTVKAGGIGGLTRTLVEQCGYETAEIREKIAALKKDKFTDDEICAELRRMRKAGKKDCSTTNQGT